MHLSIHQFTLSARVFRVAGQILFAALLLASGDGVKAQVAAVVTVAADIPAERHFMMNSVKWEQQLTRLAQIERHGANLVGLAREAAAITGDPRRSSARISGGANVLESYSRAASLRSAEVTVREARPQAGVSRELLGYYDGKRTIGEAFEAPKASVRRDTWLYADLAREDAMRDRHQRALQTLDQVEAEEIRVVRELHARLRGSPTLAEVDLIRAALEGVALRTEYARSQAARAFAELQSVRDARLGDLERVQRARAEENTEGLRLLREYVPAIQGKGGLK